jgi:microcystin degradation protein MlrC
MTVRVAAAQIAHETSAFSAVKTDIAAFAASGIHLGEDVIETARETNTEFGGFITGAVAEGFDLVPLLAVWATPSGLVTKEAIEHLTGLLRDRLQRAMTESPLDGILLALHGAMVTEIDDDGDG